jgi:hypothetical protein
MYEQIAMYDRAADRFEEYAKRYAGEKDAGDRLADATRLRAALGDTAKQIQDTKLWIRTFGPKRPQEAAAAELSLVRVFAGDEAIAQLREFLHEFGGVDRDLTITAHADLADRLRAKACPVHAIDGLCVKIVVDRTPRCGTGTTSVVAVKRTAGNREALAEDREVLTFTPTGPAARHAMAMAKLALADDELETLIATTFPRDLDSTRMESRKRFAQWLDAELKIAREVNDAYGAVLLLKDATSSVAAAARMGEASQVMWRALMTSEVPKAMRKQPEHGAYCDEMKTVADPLRARAIEAAWTCIAKSVELEAGQDWADVCWRDGAQLDPEGFAPVRELHGSPGELAPPFALEPPITTSPVISPPPP